MVNPLVDHQEMRGKGDRKGKTEEGPQNGQSIKRGIAATSEAFAVGTKAPRKKLVSNQISLVKDELNRRDSSKAKTMTKDQDEPCG